MAKAVDDIATTGIGNSARQPNGLGRDGLMLGIVFATIILFVGTGGTIMHQVVESWMYNRPPPDLVLASAVMLNIALLLLGWGRYRKLQAEVTSTRQSEEQAQILAKLDPLTACLNRRSGTPAIEALLRRAQADHKHVCVLMVDLDNFKQINDMNGHMLGDVLLRRVAERLHEHLPPGAVLARLGGDEFVCAVLHDTNGRDRLEKLAEQLIVAVSMPIIHDGVTVSATVSVGLVSTEHHGDHDSESANAEKLLHRSDIAMYHAKKSGRNRHCWFDFPLEDELRFRNELETAIRKGIPAGEFIPYYEQQVDLKTGKLTGFEMLARWNSPVYGLMSPEAFISVAEDLDLISDLSESLIRQALTDAKDWDPSLTLSVNISPVQLRDPWFAQKLLHLLVESGFPTGRLEIEITESCLHQNIGAVRTIITSLRNQGITVSLDDFGTGYSSLAQLRSLPFDRLKIDRTFVAEMAREGGSNELVRAIISLGRGLSLPVTAEGIEDVEMLEALQGMGQMKGQGYIYGRPEDATTTRNRLAEMNLLASSTGSLAASGPLPELKAS